MMSDKARRILGIEKRVNLGKVTRDRLMGAFPHELCPFTGIDLHLSDGSIWNPSKDEGEPPWGEAEVAELYFTNPPDRGGNSGIVIFFISQGRVKNIVE